MSSARSGRLPPSSRPSSHLYGRCVRCHAVYRWPRKRLTLRRAYCPFEGAKLRRARPGEGVRVRDELPLTLEQVLAGETEQIDAFA